MEDKANDKGGSRQRGGKVGYVGGTVNKGGKWVGEKGDSRRLREGSGGS